MVVVFSARAITDIRLWNDGKILICRYLVPTYAAPSVRLGITLGPITKLLLIQILRFFFSTVNASFFRKTQTLLLICCQYSIVFYLPLLSYFYETLFFHFYQ